ncbi:MAG: methyltransferase domain-containing protein [Nitrospirae bacterium]|nr:methyltransferase domain-containing protein [Nitrospirota bacterium]
MPTKLFDQLAAQYDAWHETPLGRLVEETEREAVAALWRPRPGERVLDVSCGTGRWALDLARQGAKVIAADFARTMLSVAAGKAAGEGIRLPLLQSDLAALPFRTGTFDAVLCLLTLEFLPDKQRGLREMLRVLEPEGTLLLGVLTPWSPWAWKRRVKGWFDSGSIWRGATFLNHSDLRRLLRSLPARMESHRRAVFVPPWEPGPLLPFYKALEAAGRRFQFPTGAFLAMRIRRPPSGRPASGDGRPAGARWPSRR